MTDELMFAKASGCADSACVEIAFVSVSGCYTGSCVEVGFVKANGCGTSTCVEVDRGDGESDVLVRDSKQNGEDPQPVLRFTREEWDAFVAGVKRGEFD